MSSSTPFRPASSRLYRDVWYLIGEFLTVADLGTALCIDRSWNHYLSTRSIKNSTKLWFVITSHEQYFGILKSNDGIRKHITSLGTTLQCYDPESIWYFDRSRLHALFPRVDDIYDSGPHILIVPFPNREYWEHLQATIWKCVCVLMVFFIYVLHLLMYT